MSTMITTAEELFRFINDHADVFEDSDIAINIEVQERIQSEARALLSDHAKSPDVLDDKIVFQMHEGWAFACVKTSCVYGPVFVYEEGGDLVKKFKNLHDMLDSNEIIP